MGITLRQPTIVRHMAANRGVGAPNSLEAIEECLRAEAWCIEVDATALADSDYLLVHDHLLETETTGSGFVGACTVEAAGELRIQHRGVATDLRVPRLSEVVSALLRSGGSTRLQVDLKNVIPFTTDEPLCRLVHLLEPLGERVQVSSMADWQLRRLRSLAPWLDLGLDIHFYLDWSDHRTEPGSGRIPRQLGVYGYWDDHPLATWRTWPTEEYLADRCASLARLVPGVSTFYVSHRLLAQSLDDGFNWAEALHRDGIKLDAWTLDADNPTAVTNARKLRRTGVDQFTTNTPDELAKVLSEA